jgi:cytidylate kinase
MRMPAGVVTISASYGAGGSVVAPALAERLGWPFIDRMVTASVSSEAEDLSIRSGEGLAPGEVAPAGRLLASLARAAGAGAMMAPLPVLDTDVELRERTEAALAPVLAGGGAVVLGRAGAVVLAGRPRTLHVRLKGPVEARVTRAAAIEGVNPSTARTRMGQTDRARNTFVRRVYRRDPEDAGLYHLVVDSTAFPLEAVVEFLAAAAVAALGPD